MTARAILTSSRAGVLLLFVLCIGRWSWVCADEPAAEGPTPQAAAPRIVDVRAGFSGRFKIGCWTPFEVELEGGSEPATGRVELVAPDGDGVPSRVHAPHDVALVPGERKTVALYAKIGQLSSEVSVGFRAAGGLLAERRYSTGAEGPLAGALPSSAMLLVWVGAAEVPSDLAQRGLQGVEVAEVASLDALPDQWWGYDGVDAVVLNAAADALPARLAAPAPRPANAGPFAALTMWVRMGGRLILGVGADAEKVLAAGSPLAELAPGALESVVPLPPVTMLESYAETSEPLSTDGAQRIMVPKLRDVRGRIEAFAGASPRDLPLVVRTPRGFGQVVFVAFDLERRPFAVWAARTRLLEKLLGRVPATADDASGGTLGAVTTLGFDDLAGQLRGALDRFAGVRLVPFWLVALLVAAYIACIGPLDYFLVKRVFGRMDATWITFALTVIVFGAGAYALAYGLKGRQLRANQVDVVDFDAESKLLRGTSWVNVFSPANDTYDLSLLPVDAPPGAGVGAVAVADRVGAGRLFSWFGLPGTGFGGMDVRRRQIGGIDAASQALPMFTAAYDFSGSLDALKRVPIAVWSSKAFVGRWWGQGAAGVEGKLADNGRLVGTIASRLDAPLEDAVLIYDKWAYVIRRFDPGTTIDFEFDIDPQTADTYLRRLRALADRQVAPPYDRASFDVPRIVEMMTAHELVGGRTYTGLDNAHQGFGELSDLVRTGRAVLFGRSAKPAATLARDGRPIEAQTEHWTFYRFVFPVAEAAAP